MRVDEAVVDEWIKTSYGTIGRIVEQEPLDKIPNFAKYDLHRRIAVKAVFDDGKIFYPRASFCQKIAPPI